MSTVSSEPSERLPNSKLFFYSLVDMPLMMALFPVMVFIPKFYTTEMGVGLALAGNLMLSIRIFDIFTDPLIGYLSDRTTSRWGRRRPWILASTPMLVAGFYFLFIPPDDISFLLDFFPFVPAEYASALYMFVCMFGLSLGTTMIMIPYYSWGAELSPDYNERSRITGWRSILGVCGSILAQLLPIFAKEFFGLEGSAAVLMVVGTGMLFTLPICVFLTVWMVPETKDFVSSRTPVMEGLRLMMKNGPFKRLIAAFMVGGTALSITTPLYLFFITFVLVAEGDAPYMLAFFYTANILAVPFWVKISRRIGKHKAYIWSFVIIACAHPFYLLLGEGDFWWMTPITLATGFSAGAFAAIPNSMKADVIDLDTLESGENRAASYFATWSFTTKMAGALGGWIALNGLALIGFDPQLGTENSAEHMFGLRFMFALFPSIFFLTAAAIIWKYPITEEYHLKMRAELEERNGSAASPALAE